MSPFSLRLLLIGIVWIGGNVGEISFIQKYDGKDVFGIVGSSFNFTWTFSNGVDSVLWGLKSAGSDTVDVTKKLISIGRQGRLPLKPPSEYVGRVNGTGSVSSASVIFILANIKKSDEAFYGCEIYPVEPISTDFDYVRLVVQEKPTIRYPTDTIVSYNEGNLVNLQCSATGVPDPNVRWIHDGYVRATETNTTYFTFRSINKTDAGLYTCSASNSAGSVVKQVNVSVNYAATIKDVKTSNSKSWIGQRVSLQCVADGVPLPILTWKKPDGSSVNSLTATEIKEDLLLQNDTYFGNYTCEAKNDMGRDARPIEVKQLKAPGSPKVSVTTGATSMIVRWDPPAYDGGSIITGYLVEIINGTHGIVIRNSTASGFSSLREVKIGKLRKHTNYTVRVKARNVVSYGKAAEIFTKTKFVGAPTAVSTTCIMEDGNMSITWKQPDNNGADITQYKVYQRKGNEKEWEEIKIIEDNSTHKYVVSDLEKGEWYAFVITATNKYGESLQKGSCARVEVPGGVPSVVTTTCSEGDGKVTLTWKQPDKNGAAITLYKVYQKKGSEKNWMEIATIEKNSTHEYVVRNLEKDEVYVFLVTATNEYGESVKEGNCKGVKVPEDLKPTTDAQTGGINTVVVAGAAAAGVLLIIGVIIFGIWWKRRKISSDDASSSGAALRSDNPYELDDGYQDVSASAAAAGGLQAEAGPVAEPDYAQVDVSKKKRNRRPVTDEYAQVDKSKKSKKPRKQPGDLNYAELDDFRPSLQPAAAAAAEAAPARPLIRRPAYEGTEYADITQFGVPQPEPTYGNIPKKDVVYSNVQGI